ncbi:MAG: hypothetical protein IPL32_20355 [Chloracidobacterium sp.]|nr:hypothetical protein [Chloracidobacterium sp.]MBK8468174.1 hypothetical protein [Chloracidobacterium sp.]
MTLAQLKNSPKGTTEINSGETIDCPAGRPEMKFVAVHYEKGHRKITPRLFYAATEAEALEKAREHDRKRKEQFTKWKINAKTRRQTGATCGK